MRRLSRTARARRVRGSGAPATPVADGAWPGRRCDARSCISSFAFVWQGFEQCTGAMALLGVNRNRWKLSRQLLEQRDSQAIGFSGFVGSLGFFQELAQRQI